MKLCYSILVNALTLALACVCGVKIISDGYGWTVLALAAAAAVIAFPLSSLLHELGHMLFGACVAIKAMPDDGLGVFLRRIFLSWWKASSCSIIPKTDKGLRGRVIFTALGGVAVNCIFIVLGIVALCVPTVPTYLSALLPASFNLVALNAVPMAYDGGDSDGEVVLNLIKNSDKAQVMLAVLTVQAQILKGKRMEEIDESLLFFVPQIAEDEAAFISLAELRYEYFKAKGDAENAEKWLSRYKQLKEYL